MEDFFFYFSYAPMDMDSDPSPYCFFQDLRQEVCVLTGLQQTGFMDKEILQPSDFYLWERWELQIAEALSRSRVLVALYSPAYFRNEFCGKLWTVFLWLHHMR